MIDLITLPALGQSPQAQTETVEFETASSQALRVYLSGRVGDLLTVRLVEVLSPEKLLLEVAGAEVVAKGSAPPGSTGLFTVRLEGLEPVVRFSLADQAESELPLLLRRIMGEVVVKPNLFSRDVMLLKELLLDESASLSTSLRNDLHSLTARFSAASLLAGLRSGEGLPLAQLGLFYEQGLAQLLSSEPDKIYRLMKLEPFTTKEILLRLLVVLEADFSEEIFRASGSESKMIAKVHSSLRSMLDLVELNQYLNNSGLRNDAGFVLVMPLWGWGESADLWLRLTRDGEAKSGGGRLLIP